MPSKNQIEQKLNELCDVVTGAVEGNALCACGEPLHWRRIGMRWEGKCERGHEMGGKLVAN